MLSKVLQIAGAVAVTAGCGVLAVWLGLIVGGVLLLAFGVALALESGD